MVNNIPINFCALFKSLELENIKHVIFNQQKGSQKKAQHMITSILKSDAMVKIYSQTASVGINSLRSKQY
jgi:hypothetical protein